MKYKDTVETITPEMAKEMVSTPSPMQRPLKWAMIVRYAQTMKRGDWVLTHQGLCLAPDGTVIDGQHRLHACVNAGVPFEVGVRRYTEAKHGEIKMLFDAIDFGKTRSLGFTMQSVHGWQNANRLAAVVRILGSMCARYNPSLLPDQALDIYNIFKPEIEECSILAGEGVSKFKFLSGLIAGGSFLLRADNKLAPFIKRCFTGENIDRSNPEFVLRSALQNGMGGRHRMFNVNVTALAICCAAMAYINKKTITMIRITYGPLDEWSAMIPKEVERVRNIVGPSPGNLKRAVAKQQEEANHA